MSERKQERPAWGPRRVAAATLLPAALLALFALVRTARLEWSPIADNAVTWMRTWDVGTPHSPLIGPHSRLGFHHPGPMLFYVLAVPLRLLGGAPSALLAGALAVGLGAAVGAVLLAARQSNSETGLVLAVAIGVLAVGNGSDRLIEPWNPFLLVLPFALFLVAVWLASAGHFGAALAAAATGSFAAQSHLGAVPPVLVLGAAGLLLRVAWPPPGAPRLPDRRRSGAVLALLAFLWAPPIIEEHTREPGNISTILSYFSQKGLDAPVGWKNGLRMAGTELLPWGPWIGREHVGFLGDVLPSTTPLLTLGASLAPLVAGFWLAFRFRDGLVLRLVVLEAFAFVACVASLAEIRGIAFYYLVLWTRPIAMLCAALPVIAVTRRYWSAREESPLRRVVLRALAVSAVTVPIAICALRAEVPTPYWSRVHREVVARAIEAVPPKTTVRVVSIGPFYQGSAETIAVALERKGRFPKLMPWYSTAVGGHRTVGPRTNLPTLVLATGIGIERVPHRETARVLYERDPYSAEKRAETIELRKHLEAQFVVGGRRDLVDPLDSGVPWLWLVLPSSVDRHDFDRYTDLVVGDAKVPVVLYQLRPTTW